MAHIPYVDFFTALARWQEVCESDRWLDRFLGARFGDILKHIDYVDGNMYFAMPSEIANKFHMLCGPHYKAIIKAYLIKQDEEL